MERQYNVCERCQQKHPVFVESCPVCGSKKLYHIIVDEDKRK